MGKASTLVVLLTSLSGCAAEATGQAPLAIRGGAPDPGDSGVVGVILEDTAAHRKRVCTGTLVAPDLVLTAQHCVADTQPFVNCESSTFGQPSPAERILVTPCPSLWSDEASWTRAAEVITPPGGPFVCGRDVALLRLTTALTVTPILPRLDEGPRAEEPYAAIGYGLSADRARDAGLRRRREALRVLCVGEDCQSPQIAADEWRGDHGICAGDSGGPAIDAEGQVIGVTSRGPVTCERPVYGAVAPHAPWMREAARVAAASGGHAAPAWAEGDDLVVEGGGGCALAAPRPESIAPWCLAALVGLVAARRRR